MKSWEQTEKTNVELRAELLEEASNAAAASDVILSFVKENGRVPVPAALDLRESVRGSEGYGSL